jgi:uncharacterized protein (TIRG00374 family)
VVSAIAVAVLLAVADVGRAVDALLAARPAELAAAAAVFAIGLVGRAACSRELVDGRGGLGGAFAALTIGYLINNLLPLRAGEVARALVLGRRSGLGAMGGAAAVAAERLLDLVLAATILVSGLAAVGLDTSWASAAMAAVAAVAGMATLVLVARNRLALAVWLEARLGRWPRLASLVPRAVAALEGFARPRRLARAALILAASWALAVVVFWLVMRAFIPAAPLAWAVFGLGVMAFGIALPSSPGAVGVYEAAWVSALAMVGADPADALAFAVAAHAMTFGITTLCGLVCLAREVPGGNGGVAAKARRLLAGRPTPVSEEATQ